MKPDKALQACSEFYLHLVHLVSILNKLVVVSLRRVDLNTIDKGVIC